MDASRRWQPVKEPLWWLALLLALLGGMWSDYGLADGLERFAVFVYWGSCTLVIMQLSASLLVRIPLSKPGVLVPGSIVIAYAVVQGTRLGVESVWKGALLGLYFLSMRESIVGSGAEASATNRVGRENRCALGFSCCRVFCF